VSVIIAGTGVVSPIGIGNEAFLKSLQSGFCGIRMSTLHAMPCGQVAREGLDALLRDRRFRRAASFSRFALAAAQLALADAGCESVAGEASALVLATMHGASNYTQEFHRELVLQGIDGASPMLFADSVLNAAVGNVSLCFGIRGPAHTIIGGATAFLKSVRLAKELLEQKEAAMVMVVASEELNEIELSCYSRLGYGPLAEGGGALLLTASLPGDGNPCVQILAAASFCNPADPCRALDTAVSECLEDAGIRSPEIGLILTDCNDLPERFGEIPRFSPAAGTGQAFAASGSWLTIAATLLLRPGAAPFPAFPDPEKKAILVYAVDDGGVASAVIIARRGQ